jgi:hypothetical protein
VATAAIVEERSSAEPREAPDVSAATEGPAITGSPNGAAAGNGAPQRLDDLPQQPAEMSRPIETAAEVDERPAPRPAGADEQPEDAPTPDAARAEVTPPPADDDATPEGGEASLRELFWGED